MAAFTQASTTILALLVICSFAPACIATSENISIGPKWPWALRTGSVRIATAPADYHEPEQEGGGLSFTEVKRCGTYHLEDATSERPIGSGYYL